VGPPKSALERSPLPGGRGGGGASFWRWGFGDGAADDVAVLAPPVAFLAVAIALEVQGRSSSRSTSISEAA
jgi:hypothetical protein